VEGDRFVRRIYATDRVDQDAYNYAIKYSGGSLEHPIYIRSYVTLRSSYAPLASGSADPDNSGAVLVEEEVAPMDGELNSLYIKVNRVYETLPGPVITSYDTNETGQVVTVTTQRKAKDGYTLPAASATSSFTIQSEDVDVVTEQIRTIPSIFQRRQFSADRPDMLPQKFRAAVPDVETSELVVGTASQPTLGQGDISASETQQTLFVKQVSRRSRVSPTYPVTITETTTTRQGQVALVTSTLDDGPQTADSGPLVESSEVTDLGDGRTIKVTTEVDEVFTEPSFTKSREDVTPVKFRALSPETVEEETVSGTAEMPVSLDSDELSRTEQQLTLQKKRTQVRKRTPAASGTLTGKVYTSELGGGTADVTEQYGSDVDIDPGFGTVAAEKEALGDGNSVTREVVLSEPPELQGQIYDEELDIVFPFTQQYVQAGEGVGTPKTEVQPRDVHHALKRVLDTTAFRTAALAEHWQVGAYVDVVLPDVLEGVEVVFSKATGSGAGTGTGDNYSVMAEGSTSVTADVRWVIKSGYRGPVPATRHVFFLDKNAAGISAIRTKTGANDWPAVFPEPVTITSVGGSVTKRVSSSVSFSCGTDECAGGYSNSSSTSFGSSLSTNIVTVPSTLHASLNISSSVIGLSAESSGGAIIATAPDLNGAFRPSSISATSPAKFPTGNFLAAVDTQSYKYGLVRVTAIVAHITSTYVG
jgi:hypothetical protein